MKVLLATDGFDPALDAAELLERIADPARVSVTVMSVTPTGIPAPGYAPLMLDGLSERREQSAALVDGLAEIIRRSGFAVRGLVAEGHPAEEIIHALERDRYDLAVLGSGRTTWLGQRLLGSVSTHVLHTAPSSVMVTHHIDRSIHQPTALLAVDGSAGAHAATRALANLCDPRRVRVQVASVAHPPMYFTLPGAVAISAFPTQAVLDQLLLAAEQHVDVAATKLRDAGFEVTTTVLEGSVVEQILKQAEATSADLVTVGARGLGPIQRTLLGSVSDQVVRHSAATLVGRRRIEADQA